MDIKPDLLDHDEQARFIAAARAWNRLMQSERTTLADSKSLYDHFRTLMDAASEGFDD